MNYSAFGVLAIKAIQEQQQQINTLQDRIANVELRWKRSRQASSCVSRATSRISLLVRPRLELSTEHSQTDQAHAQTEHGRDSLRNGRDAQKPTNLSAREILRMNI